MAKRNRNPFKRGGSGVKNINTWADNINNGMHQLYRDTYISDRRNLDDMNQIADDIESSISQIVRRNSDNDLTGMTKLYSKLALQNASNDAKLHTQIESLFGEGEANGNLLSSYMSNKWIHDLDIEIDTVLKYCTKMGEALELLKDAVLSSDSSNKDTVLCSINTTDEAEMSIFEDRMKTLTKKYSLNECRDKWYRSASWYGEAWVYCVPYNKAIKRLLDNRNTNLTKVKEMAIIENGTLVGEAASYKGADEFNKEFKGTGFKVQIDPSRTLMSALKDAENLNESVIRESNIGSLAEAFHEAKNEKLDKTVPDDLELPPGFGDSSEGLYVGNNKNSSNNDIKVKGAVLQKLKRENIIPLYIQDTCMGYYYLEFNNPDGLDFYNTILDKYGKGYEAQATNPISKTINDGMLNSNTDTIIHKISVTIAKQLDATFINSNQDLAKEIYTVLKHNEIFTGDKGSAIECMKISFLPVEDVHRLVFNEDEDTHRGISDCAKGLIPAKLFSCLYLTNTMGIMTRGQDKRVYYVKQTIDTNIAQTLLNVINQIKKSNFNIRQIENMNNILNIVGRFNDYFIPVGPSGDSPVQFEVMQGQSFEINSDLYNMLEEMAVNSTGVPIELVQSRNSPDFATQFTSSSLKMLRMVYNRQSVMEEFLSSIYTKIYNYEYPEDDEGFVTVNCELPPPIFLSMTNTTQLIQNAKEYVTQISEMEFAGNDSETADKERAVFERKFLKAILASYVKAGDIERYRKAAKFEVERQMKDNTSV